MNEPYDVLLDTLTPATTRESTLPELDRKPDPWESSMQATCECLSWRGAFDNLERRHAEDALGETIYHDFPVRARSAVVTAHTLMERGVISPEELRARMDVVRERFHRE
ncbi:Nitrile hydratase beta subunit [Nocardia amikacinitolerans]|uniref:Nitrile hydratase beta subunit n=1 Tax=Nocardia amikacinitolerans TaxID=756689 RepID=A0A285L7Y9_9NOCA|nr:SH3-like domain-containing protein [Nocardia amikacinitolerans]MCP2275204.1 Nitrile hydratase beta subunit [Nocardia amikacinitolerans]MCP2296057.1 Nitrile hydratase beta subunit [Nocardia amikacinitolerans]SNY80992.1 Nitrile hydratase beta subunit [Nocardia amikacinitolerans]